MPAKPNKSAKLALILIAIGIISPAVFGVSQSIELEEGWNTISVDVQDVSVSDLQDECSGLSAYEGEYAWVLEADAWSNPDTLPTAKGLYVTTSSDCTINLEGDEANPSELNIHAGWNIISLSGDITWSSVLECDIQPYSDHRDWILTGNSWSHLESSSGDGPPTPGDGGDIESKGIMIQSNSECSVTSQGADIPQPGDQVDNSDSGDSDSSNTDGSSANTDINPGDLYFWDVEASTGLVNNEAGSPGDEANLEYDMYDNDVIGDFTSHGENQAERTVVVENEYSGETASNTGSGAYVGVPQNSATWGTDQSGVYEMSNNRGTDFTVKVKDPESGEVVQEETFTFTPGDIDESSTSDDSDTSYDYGRYDDYGSSGSNTETVTSSYINRNSDHVTDSGSGLEIDGSNSNNAYVTWVTDMGANKVVEVDFEVTDKGHTRFEVCGSNCGDGGNIKAAYYFFGNNEIGVDQPYSNSYDEKVGEYETGSTYTFKIAQYDDSVTMHMDGPGVDSTKSLDNIDSFRQFSVDTEAGTNDNWNGIDLTVTEVTKMVTS